LRVVAIGGFAQSRPGQCFDGVTAQQLHPIFLEEVARSENVAPSDFAAVSYDDSDDAFVFEATRFTRETAMDFLDATVHVSADPARFVVDAVVGFCGRFRLHNTADVGHAHLRSRRRGSCAGGGAGADSVPNFALFLSYRCLFSYAGMNDSLCGGEIPSRG